MTASILDFDLGAILRSYQETAVWSTTYTPDPIDGVEQDPVEMDTTQGEWSLEATKKSLWDIIQFVAANDEDLKEIPENMIGHDLWLTRCGHGAGFWDGDYPEDIGDRLTAACDELGEVWLDLGDDGFYFIT